MKITVHTLVKNEARFIWYSVMSVIKYVDRVRLWDTGSTDNTLEIIDEVAKPPEAKGKEIFQIKKLNLEKFNEAELRSQMLIEDTETISKKMKETLAFSLARQKMLEATTADWFIVLDGDEIWWEDSIKEMVTAIKEHHQKYDCIVVPTVNVVGDMFHYQEKPAGRYHLAGRVGHYNLRAVNRKVPGLHAKGEHGVFGWADENGVMIENRDPKRILFLDAPYLHTTHLRRAGVAKDEQNVLKRKKKKKFEIGISFSKDYYYPEVFFRPRPEMVPSVWGVPSLSYKVRAFFETPLRKIHRRTFLKYQKHGY